MYEEEVAFLAAVENRADKANQRRLLDAAAVERIREEFPGIPEDYLAYLREIGSGTVRECQYQVHKPDWCHEEPLFSWFETRGRKLLVIGHDYSGNLFAFDAKHNYRVVELLHESMEVWPFKRGGFRSSFGSRCCSVPTALTRGHDECPTHDPLRSLSLSRRSREALNFAAFDISGPPPALRWMRKTLDPPGCRKPSGRFTLARSCTSTLSGGVNAMVGSSSMFCMRRSGLRRLSRRGYPHIPFERYADDAICHCKSAEEAQALGKALADRLSICKLVMHPEKTKIVYCKDVNRRIASSVSASVSVVWYRRCSTRSESSAPAFPAYVRLVLGGGMPLRVCRMWRTAARVSSSNSAVSDGIGNRDIGSLLEALPKTLEPVPCNPRVMCGVLGITMAEVVLHGAEIGAPVGEIVAARVTEHVRPDPAELCGLAGYPNNVVDGLTGQLRLSFRDEQPRKLVLPGG